MSAIILFFAGALGVAMLLYVLAGICFVPNRKVGVVEKRWSPAGAIESGLIALHGEAGFQPDVLRGGVYWFPPLQYRIHILPLVTVPQGQLGYVFARDGVPLAPAQTLGSNLRVRLFEDAAKFLRDGGQRGPQRAILREGTYAINLALFAVFTADHAYSLPLGADDRVLFERMQAAIAKRNGFRPVVIEGSDDSVGVVTVHDGPALTNGEVIAPVVATTDESMSGHNGFQDPEAFILAGGRRGRQLEVLVEGTYHLNCLFATVELIPKTVVEVGSVGVVVWYAGRYGADLSGADYKHGELVKRGERGVWSVPLLPGKYPFNTYAGKVIVVPTTNFILKWIKSEVGAHRFDENLTEVSLITRDAFEPSLPLSVVVHIDYKQAPLVIQRFGDIRRLVEQTLDPMVSAYFKNIGQIRTLIQLLQDRSAIQKEAATAMREKFAHYNLELEEVLIGTPTASHDGDERLDQILAQLRARQIAEEQIETYARMEQASIKERVLRQAQAHAKRQDELTSSEIAVTIAGNQGRAEYERAVQQAAQIRTLADAESEKLAKLGEGQAVAIREQVAAWGGPRYQLAKEVMGRFADAVREGGVELVPRVVIGGGAGGHSGAANAIEALLGMLLDERLLKDGVDPKKPTGNPEA